MTRALGVDMDMEDIKLALHTALQLRPPMFEEGYPGREKVARLEDYLLASAYAAAELEEALHWLDSMVAHFKRQVDEMTGWEVALPAGSHSRPNKEDINIAKRTVNPVVFDAGAEVRQLQVSVKRQIDRLRFEAQWIISRCYTMITGS